MVEQETGKKTEQRSGRKAERTSATALPTRVQLTADTGQAAKAKAAAKRKRRVTPELPVAQVMSFLKDTRGALTWTTAEMAKALGISIKDAKQVLAVMRLQGYVKHNVEMDQWMTTLAGEAVSESKKPRFTPENVEEALESLRERIRNANKDAHEEFKVSDVVAFGDFLEDSVGHGARVQAADVGIRLVRRKGGAGGGEGSAREREARQAFLKKLRGNVTMLNLREHEEWMSARSHRRL